MGATFFSMNKLLVEKHSKSSINLLKFTKYFLISIVAPHKKQTTKMQRDEKWNLSSI